MTNRMDYARIAVTESVAAAARTYADNNESLSEATDVGVRETRATDTPIFISTGINKPTAFTVKGPRTSVVVLTEALVSGLQNDEVEAVLQHELAHANKQDGRQHIVLSLVTTTAPFMLGRLAQRRFGRGAGFLVFAAAQAGGFLLTRWVSRQRELDADRKAAKEMGDPEPVQRALSNIAEANEAPFEHSFITGLITTHPSVNDRVAALHDGDDEDSEE